MAALSSPPPPQRRGETSQNSRVLLPRDVVAHGVQRRVRQPAQLGAHERVRIAVQHEQRRVAVELGLGQQLAELHAQQQPRGQRHDARQLHLGGQPREDGHGTALTKPAEHDAVRRDARVDLLLHEPVQVLAAGLDARRVLVGAHGLYLAVEHGLCRYKKCVHGYAIKGKSVDRNLRYQTILAF